MSVPFKISKFPRAEEKLRALAKQAMDQGDFQAFLGSLQRIYERLKANPHEWGDPEYNTKHPGGVVCHAIESPFLVHFAVYEAEQVVCLLDIELLPDAPLGNP
jgi:hypothetical protein